MERRKLSRREAEGRHPRELALRVLTQVLSDARPLDEALAESTASENLAPQARAWLQDVCSGTLRWKGVLDQAIDATALKKKPSGWLRKAMLVAVYQLVVQDRAAAGAVVSETVDQVKGREGEAPARFVNACLRKLADGAARWRSYERRGEASLPPWLWKRLVADHGAPWARAFAEACLERPTLWLRARGAEFKPDWAEPGPLQGSWRAIEGGAVAGREGLSEGAFIVQDISSQRLVAEISARAGTGIALDLCAAPGGKAVGLAWNGWRVTATDRPARLALLTETARRAASGIEVTERARVSALPPQDLVWVDAPCTGTGIVRRHPEVRWLKSEKDIAVLARGQRELLREAWGKVRPGGHLAYSVCSVLNEEGPGALAAAGLDGAETAAEWLLAPQDEPWGDGFWAALVRKSGG